MPDAPAAPAPPRYSSSPGRAPAVEDACAGIFGVAPVARVLRSAGVIAWEWNPATDTVRVTGSDPAGSMERRLPELLGRVHADNRADLRAAIEQAVRSGVPFDHAFRLAGAGERRAHAAGVAVADGGGGVRLTGVVALSDDAAARVAIDQELRDSEDRYRLIVERSPEAIAVHRNGELLYLNRAAAALIGSEEPEAAVGKSLFHFVHPDYHDLARAMPLSTDVAAPPTALKFVGIDGRVRDVEGVSAPVMFGGEPAVQTVGRDVTARRETERQVRDSEDRLRAAEQHARRMADRMRAVAGAASLVLAADSPDTLQAVLRQACGMVMSFDTFAFGLYDEVAHALDYLRDPRLNVAPMRVALTGAPSECVVLDRRSLVTLDASDPRAAGAAVAADGRQSESIIRSPMYTAEGVLGVLSVQSYTPGLYGDADVEVFEAIAALGATALRNQRLLETIRRSEERLAYQAFHDPLTDLANRTLFLQRVGSALAREGRTPESVAVLFLDLDNFKTVNDSLGHTEGDRLLVAAAERLLNATRGCDTVARLGGDEFAVLLTNVRSDADLVTVAARITSAMRSPFALVGTEVFVSASIGIARAAEGSAAEELLRNADAAMYTAKTRGKGRHVLFEASMHAEVVARLELEADLRRAISHDEFRLLYQPIVRLSTGELMGVEALVRWEHPDRGTVQPSEFVSFAEETGLIVPIGRWVLREACRQGAAWHATLRPGQSLQITVNLSGRQLHEATLVDEVRAALEDSGLPPSALVLEVTESVMVEHTDTTFARLQQLRSLGVSLAVDDFGTGYSSLSYLQRFPIDTLKIDKSFVDSVGHGTERDPVLARAIIALGEALHLRTVAEGIEHAAQAEELLRLGCELGQGYHWAPPVPGTTVSAQLAAGGVWPPCLAAPSASPRRASAKR